MDEDAGRISRRRSTARRRAARRRCATIAVKNPEGARCDVYDHAVNMYGRDPQTGFARRPLDNVGVQYGLGGAQ